MSWDKFQANLLTDLSYHLITPNTSGSIYNVLVLVQAIALYEHKECRIIVLLHFYTYTISQYGLSKSLVLGYWVFVQFVIGQIVQFLTAQLWRSPVPILFVQFLTAQICLSYIFL